jgi:hypothetical protein
MALFPFKIWDKRRMTTFNDEGDMVMTPHPDTSWIKRTMEIETDQLRITSFQEDEIYADEHKSKACVQVYLSDEDSVFAAYSLESWEKLYQEKYLPLIPKNLSDIIDDLQDGPG